MRIPTISLVDFILGMSQKTEKRIKKDYRSEIRINREFLKKLQMRIIHYWFDLDLIQSERGIVYIKKVKITSSYAVRCFISSL